MKTPRTFNDLLHRQGRIFVVLGFTVMISIPVTMWLVTGVAPNAEQFFAAFLTISLLQLPGGIIEVITYSPMLGTSATYLAFITGNLSNLKIPCAMNSRQLCGTEIGTPQNEIVSTIAVSASTITTTLIMTVGVVMLIPLTPVLESPVLKPAFEWVVSALFGALGYKYFRSNLKFVPVPLAAMILMGILLPGFVVSNLSILIVIGAIISTLAGKFIFDRSKRKAAPPSPEVTK
jgi:hypothetical protein